jgi:hypothetical protein
MDNLNSNDLNFFLCSIMLCKNRSKETKMIIIKNFLESHFGPLNSVNIYSLLREYQIQNEIIDLENMKRFLCTRLPENFINFIPFICYLINLEEDINKEICLNKFTSESIKHDHCYH